MIILKLSCCFLRTVYLDWSCYKNKGGEPTKTLMISGIIQNVSEEAIRKHFSRYGVIDMIVRAQEGKKKFSRFAFIHYRDKSSVDKALEDQEHSIDGHFVDCRRARNFRSDHGSDTKKKSEVLTKSTPAVIKIPSSFDPSIVDVTKLLIQNLSPNITAEMLRKHFSQYGTVIDAYVPTFYGTADPKGFGYIVMPSQEANFNSNKHVLMGRNLSVRADFSSDIALKTTTLLVSAGPEIMSKVTENDLKIFFSRFGPISSVRKPLDCLTKKASHYGFVEFTSHESVDKAMSEFDTILVHNKFYMFIFLIDRYQKIWLTRSTVRSYASQNPAVIPLKSTPNVRNCCFQSSKLFEKLILLKAKFNK